MEEVEIYPGKTVWAVTDLADKMRKNGALGLIHGIGKEDLEFKETAEILVKILKNGALSSQDRFQNGLFITGMSSEADLRSGGGDQVFTRLVTEETKGSMTNIYGMGKIQILFDLDVVNRGGTPIRKISMAKRIPIQQPIERETILSSTPRL